MNFRSILFCFFIFLGNSAQATSTFDTVANYATRMPEYPPSIKIWGNSDFTEFHTKHVPNIFFSWLDSWRYGSHNFFTINYFQQTLEKALGQKKVAPHSSTIAARIRCPENSTLFIVSSLRGNMHRLIRTLTWFHKQGLIDSDLKLRKDIYLFFNAYSINGSAYALETLTLIMMLMDRNPDNCFLLRSRQELNNAWNDFSLKRELKVRAYQLDVNMLQKKLNLFFNSLPKVAYVCIDTHEQDFIKISSNLDQEDLVEETKIYDLFNSENKLPVAFFTTDDTSKSLNPPDIKAAINSESLYLKPKSQFGLIFAEQNLERTFWSIFPAISANDTSERTNMVDSYISIELKKSLDSSLISFWQQKKDTADFVKTDTFNLITGISTQVAQSNTLSDPITIGSTMSLINGVPYIGGEIKQGMITRINAQNKSGGIQGHLIKSSIYNDDYSPNLALANIQKLLADSVNMILFPVGSPTLSLYFDYVKDNEISVFFPVTGASVFRLPTASGIIHLRASYAEEIHFLIEYLTKHIGAKKFAFFYQEDAYGTGSAQAAQKEVKKIEGASWLDLAYTRGTLNFEKQVKGIKEYQPDAIGFFSTAQAARLLILQLGIEQCTNKHFFANSFIAEKSFRFFIEANGLNFLSSSTVPNPVTSQLPIAQEYRQAMDEIKKPYDRFSFESYIGTSLFIDVAQKLNQPITRQSIMKALESLHAYTYKGLSFSFNPETRSLAQAIWLETAQHNEWIEKKLNNPKINDNDSNAALAW